MKKKGTRAERELLHMLWDNNWAVVRAAGSGSMPIPTPDIIASNKLLTLAIECKFIKGEFKYLESKEVEDLELFSERFGAQPWIAIKFNNRGWHFLNPSKLERTKSGKYIIKYSKIKDTSIKPEDILSLRK